MIPAFLAPIAFVLGCVLTLVALVMAFVWIVRRILR